RSGVWELVAAGESGPGTIRIQVPERAGGTWRLWLTDLPADDVGDGSASVGEVRFRR
ncbi:MAG: hypothetical protein GWM91_21615, partial [Actinobacteria bacterium]|nr:hypothetical protein [Actinomycetota bacterium]NIX52837.1 hypothetical protein [Actinomycetota bacterium]